MHTKEANIAILNKFLIAAFINYKQALGGRIFIVIIEICAPFYFPPFVIV